MTIAVALKWVDLSAEVDPLTGAAGFDARRAGASDADRAALEVALRSAEAWGETVTAITVGPPGADAVLRAALAAGATEAVRVEARHGLPSDLVAAGLAKAVRASRADLVFCGDWSLDRGSGSVPPYLAAELGWGQACGLVGLRPAPAGGSAPRELTGERRLDRGGRERLRIRGPAVVSLEGSVARLRREPLSGVLAAQSAPIAIIAAPSSAEGTTGHGPTRPYRPRARVLPGPGSDLDARQRILSLTGALTERRPPRRMVLEPVQAAEVILAQLSEWGVGPEAE